MRTRSNRLKKIPVSADVMWDVLFNRRGDFIESRQIAGVPDDAVIEHVGTEEMPLRFYFIVSHPSFPEMDAMTSWPVHTEGMWVTRFKIIGESVGAYHVTQADEPQLVKGQ